jgi:Cu(I)/Ag(I) efflux system membrane fusion protein
MNRPFFIIPKPQKNNFHLHFMKLKILSLALLTGIISFFAVSCGNKQAAGGKPDNVDYYTCTMHPSVRSQNPNDKCPICGMDLVPVLKKTAVTNAPVAGGEGTNQTPVAENQPGEFTVPIERQQQIGVTYVTVEKKPAQFSIRTVGTVAYDTQRHWDYVARVESYVEKLSVFSPGQVVEKKTPLLTIYSPDLLTTENEFMDLLRTRDEAKNSSALSESTARLIASTKDRLRLWNVTDDQIAELEKTRQPMENVTLTAPFRGVVQSLDTTQGAKVMPGDKLVGVTDLSDVWVWAQFYQDELPLLKSDLPVVITASSLPGEKFDGTISVIDPFVNDALRAARVRIDVKNPDSKLWPGMYVNAELKIDEGENLAVPVNAVLPTGQHNIVFVDKGEGKLEPRFIELGRQFGDFYQVKSGLNEGERVVDSANFLIDAESQIQGALKSW